MKKDKEIIVGYQGVQGSFSSQASMELFGEDVTYINRKYFEDIFESIEKDEIDYGILPIENTSTGAISEVYDLLLKYPFYIVGERSILVKHNILGVKGSKLEDIKEVYSHPQAYQQSSDFFKDHEDIQFVPYHNTAISAKYIHEENNKTKAAIASKNAAKIYDLDIIAENINHNAKNITRFIVISKQDIKTPTCDKTSIVACTPHIAGALYKLLGFFAENNINLVKLESRPIIDSPWDYSFIVDFDGNIEDDNVQQALKKVEDFSIQYKYLGNYKSHRISGGSDE